MENIFIIFSLPKADKTRQDYSVPNNYRLYLMSALPETGYLRLPQIIGDKKAKPPIPAIIPIARSTFLNGVRAGKYPKSIKLSPGVTVWKVEDIRAFIEKTGGVE